MAFTGTFDFHGKKKNTEYSLNRDRYYERVLREKLTFGNLISRLTLIIGQNSKFLPKKSKMFAILYARLGRGGGTSFWA